MGAAALALEAHGKRQIFEPRIEATTVLPLKGLEAYRRLWRELCLRA